jgi:hypothetical protein
MRQLFTRVLTLLKLNLRIKLSQTDSRKISALGLTFYQWY